MAHEDRDVTAAAPSSLDEHFARRLKMRRTILGVDFASLGRLLGCSARDIEDYEAGRRSFDATFIHRLSRALEVPIVWFYDGVGAFEDMMSLSPGASPRQASDEAARQLRLAERSRALLTYFETLDDEQQKAVVDITRLLSMRRLEDGATVMQ